MRAEGHSRSIHSRPLQQVHSEYPEAYRIDQCLHTAIDDLGYFSNDEGRDTPPVVMGQKTHGWKPTYFKKRAFGSLASCGILNSFTMDVPELSRGP